MNTLEINTLAKVTKRLVPFLIVCYFVAYLDRVNVGFAALTMNQDLGLSQTAFGFGAGIFFIAYFLFEVPSNLLLERFGARKWIARIMLSWGLLSGLMAFIPNIARATGMGNENAFYLIRVLLGAAEAGFFPGIIFYLTLWFPAEYRARIVGYFMAAIPLSTVIGAPISGLLLTLHGAGGLAGWQWLFIIEAVPAIILSGFVFFYLTDKPADATWLATDERNWLNDRLTLERKQREAVQEFTVGQALVNPHVIGLSLVYFGAVATNYGLGFFLPQIVKAFGLTTFMTTVVSATPYVVGTIAMVWWGRRSDRVGERRWHTGDSAVHCRRRHRRVHRARRSHAEDDRVLRGGLRHLCLPARVLDPADRLPVGCCRRRRYRGHQFDRQSRGLCRSVRDGLDQGPHRQLYRRIVAPGRARHHRDGHRAQPQPQRCARAGAGTRRKVNLPRRVTCESRSRALLDPIRPGTPSIPSSCARQGRHAPLPRPSADRSGAPRS